MAVAPRHVPACRRSRRIAHGRLAEQHERPIGDSSAPTLRFRRCDLRQRSAQMQRARAAARIGRPRNRRRERPVHLEHAHAVAIALEFPPIPRRESVARDPEQRRRRQIAHHDAGWRQRVDRRDRRIGDDFAAERSQMRDERARDVTARRRAASASRRRGTSRPARVRRRRSADDRAAACRERRAREHRPRARVRELADGKA